MNSNACDFYSEQIILYINKTINSEDKIKLLRHFSTCKSCCEELNFSLKLKKAINSVNEDCPNKLNSEIFMKIRQLEKAEKATVKEIVTQSILRNPLNSMAETMHIVFNQLLDPVKENIKSKLIIVNQHL